MIVHQPDGLRGNRISPVSGFDLLQQGLKLIWLAFDAGQLKQPAQAAAELGVSPARVRRLIALGKLKATRIGARSFAIEPQDLDAVRDRKPGRPWPKKPAEK